MIVIAGLLQRLAGHALACGAGWMMATAWASLRRSNNCVAINIPIENMLNLTQMNL